MAAFPETRQSLIRQLQDPQNQAAWQEFLDLYRPAIYRTASRCGLQDADAQDLVQQVVVSVARAAESWQRRESPTPFRHWLRRVIRNATINAISRAPRDLGRGGSSAFEWIHEVPEEECETTNLLTVEYRREVFRKAAGQVSDMVHPKTWQAFELTTLDRLSVPAVAERLEMTIGNVYAARSRVMRQLRRIVNQLEES